MGIRVAAIEDIIADLQKGRYNAEIIERLGYTFKEYQSAVEGLPDLKKLKGEVDRLKEKTNKDLDAQKAKFNNTKSAPKELSELVKLFQTFVKENVTRGAGLKFDVTYKNLCGSSLYGDVEPQSAALVFISGQNPISAVFKIFYSGSRKQYHSFFETGSVNLDSYFSKSLSNPFTANTPDKIFQKEKVQAMLVEAGYKKLKTKTEQTQHEIRKLGDEKFVKVKETDSTLEVSIEGYEELRDSWKSILNITASQESSIKSKIESAVKIIKDQGGELSGSMTFDEIDYYDGVDTYSSPVFLVRNNTVSVSYNDHHDIPKAWAVEFGFTIKFQKSQKLNSSKIKSAVDYLIYAAQVMRWGDPR
jgi:hypothetical protein